MVSRFCEAFRVGLVALDRPKALNALCAPLMEELTRALGEFDQVRAGSVKQSSRDMVDGFLVYC